MSKPRGPNVRKLIAALTPPERQRLEEFRRALLARIAMKGPL